MTSALISTDDLKAESIWSTITMYSFEFCLSDIVLLDIVLGIIGSLIFVSSFLDSLLAISTFDVIFVDDKFLFKLSFVECLIYLLVSTVMGMQVFFT